MQDAWGCGRIEWEGEGWDIVVLIVIIALCLAGACGYLYAKRDGAKSTGCSANVQNPVEMYMDEIENDGENGHLLYETMKITLPGYEMLTYGVMNIWLQRNTDGIEEHEVYIAHCALLGHIHRNIKNLREVKYLNKAIIKIVVEYLGKGRLPYRNNEDTYKMFNKNLSDYFGLYLNDKDKAYLWYKADKSDITKGREDETISTLINTKLLGLQLLEDSNKKDRFM